MIPIAKPSMGEEEKKAAMEVLNSGMLSGGEKTLEFENKFAEFTHIKYAVSCNSGTSALHLSLLALGISKGDEIIVPSFSFIATANVVLMCNAKPIFCDVNPNTFNINPEKIKSLITKDTKAIIPVHLFGQPVDVKAIQEIAYDNDLYVVGDACQSHGGVYNDKMVGSLFDLECFSFYPTKNMTTIEGGMVTTNHKEYYTLMKSIRDHGREKVGTRYEHIQMGYNYRMNDLSAAIGIEQLKKLPNNIHLRKHNASYLNSNLYGYVEIPYTHKLVSHSYNQYTIKTDFRKKIIKEFRKKNIGYGIYYSKPLHHHPHLSRYTHMNLKVSEEICEQVLSLPVHPFVKQKDLDKIIGIIKKEVGR